jgi:hypothetical protein
MIVVYFLSSVVMRAAPWGGAPEKLLEMEKVLQSVHKAGSLSDGDRHVVMQGLASGDALLMSLAAYAIGQSKDPEMLLCEKSEEVLKRTPDAMAKAFLRLMLIRKASEGKSKPEKVTAITALLRDSNSFLRVEAAKELLRLDPEKGESALRAIATSDPEITARGEAFNQLDKVGKREGVKPTPQPNEHYELLLSIIEK